MTAVDSLIELFHRVGASRGAAVLLGADELSRWPDEAVSAMKSQRLIVRTGPAVTTVCTGCELGCVMPVHSLPVKTGVPTSFIVCDKRNDTNRVFVSPESLTQFKCSAELISGFVATSLGMNLKPKHKKDSERWEIGMAFGEKRSQMLCLEADSGVALNLVAGNSKIPLAELIGFQESTYLLDNGMVRRLVDASTIADGRYTPPHSGRPVQPRA